MDGVVSDVIKMTIAEAFGISVNFSNKHPLAPGGVIYSDVMGTLFGNGDIGSLLDQYLADRVRIGCDHPMLARDIFIVSSNTPEEIDGFDLKVVAALRELGRQDWLIHKNEDDFIDRVGMASLVEVFDDDSIQRMIYESASPSLLEENIFDPQNNQELIEFLTAWSLLSENDKVAYLYAELGDPSLSGDYKNSLAALEAVILHQRV